MRNPARLPSRVKTRTSGEWVARRASRALWLPFLAALTFLCRYLTLGVVVLHVGTRSNCNARHHQTFCLVCPYASRNAGRTRRKH